MKGFLFYCPELDFHCHHANIETAYAIYTNLAASVDAPVESHAQFMEWMNSDTIEMIQAGPITFEKVPFFHCEDASEAMAWLADELSKEHKGEAKKPF